MPVSLVKAIKSTHMNPINRMLHCIGTPFYIFGIVMIVGHFLGTNDIQSFDRNNSLVHRCGIVLDGTQNRTKSKTNDINNIIPIL